MARAGDAHPRPGLRDYVTGTHKYPSDLAPPGTLRGKVLRPPSYGAKLVSIDLSAAQALEGVVAVREDQFVGVAAPTTSARRQPWRDREIRRLAGGPSPLEHRDFRLLAAARARSCRRTRLAAPSNKLTSHIARPITSLTCSMRRSKRVRPWPSGRTAGSRSGRAPRTRSGIIAS